MASQTYEVEHAGTLVSRASLTRTRGVLRATLELAARAYSRTGTLVEPHAYEPRHHEIGRPSACVALSVLEREKHAYEPRLYERVVASPLHLRQNLVHARGVLRATIDLASPLWLSPGRVITLGRRIASPLIFAGAVYRSVLNILSGLVFGSEVARGVEKHLGARSRFSCWLAREASFAAGGTRWAELGFAHTESRTITLHTLNYFFYQGKERTGTTTVAASSSRTARGVGKALQAWMSARSTLTICLSRAPIVAALGMRSETRISIRHAHVLVSEARLAGGIAQPDPLRDQGTGRRRYELHRSQKLLRAQR